MSPLPTRVLLAGAAALALTAAGLAGSPAAAEPAQAHSPTRDAQVQPAAAPYFQSPLPCGQTWTYSTYPGHNHKALDFVEAGGNTRLQPALAAAAGTVVTQGWEAGGAGNYVVIDHGGGWTTHYMHLDSFTGGQGQQVGPGDEIGKIGTTGGSSGDHLHFEERLNGTAQDIHLDGKALGYPGSYHQSYLTSENCGGGQPEPPEGTPFQTYGSGINLRAESNTSSAVVGTLSGPTTVYVVCQEQGETVTAEGYTNSWWSKLSAPSAGFMTNIYMTDPNERLPGVPDC